MPDEAAHATPPLNDASIYDTAVTGRVDDEDDTSTPYLCYGVVGLILVIVVIILAVDSLRKEIFAGIESVGSEIRRDKGWGVVLYLVLYVGFALLCGPTTIPEGMAGFIFPYGWAVVLATCGRGCSTFAMCTAGRSCAASYVQRHFIQKYKWAQALVRLYETRPYKAAALISFAELPFCLKNYPYSVTKVTTVAPTPTPKSLVSIPLECAW